MDKNLHDSNAKGGKVFVTDVSDDEGFRGNWWVQFAQTGQEHNSYLVDYFDDKEDALAKADDVANTLL